MLSMSERGSRLAPPFFCFMLRVPGVGQLYELGLDLLESGFVDFVDFHDLGRFSCFLRPLCAGDLCADCVCDGCAFIGCEVDLWHVFYPVRGIAHFVLAGEVGNGKYPFGYGAPVFAGASG